MDDVVAPSSLRRGGALLALAVVCVLAYLLAPDGRAEALVSQGIIAVACLLSALAIVRWSEAWPSSRPVVVLFCGVAAANVGSLVVDAGSHGAYRPQAFDVAALLLLMPLVVAARDEFRAHLEAPDRREIAIDVGLIAASFATIAFVLIRPVDAGATASTSSAVYAIVAAVMFTTFAAIALWVPTPAHVLLFLGLATASAGVLRFGWEWSHGVFDGTSVGVDVPWVLAPVSIAAVLCLLPHDRVRTTVSFPSRIARPVLTSAAVMAACAALIVLAVLDEWRGVAGLRSGVLIVLLGGGVAVRILASQLASTQAHGSAQDALARREDALREADRALERVREANATLRDSEEHLRLVFDAAVDGFVELDETDVVLRANDAFAQMIGIDRRVMVGMDWPTLTASVPGADPSLATLPVTGQGKIHRTEGQPLFLEARMSRVPTDPPRRLLLVRDVTSAKVADQTIRSLFQFLQDRDEDRTRLFRRTNAAIEQERNRIARDLHDGPVQGVSAASLSLEAALLMIKAGDLERGLDVLGTIREELATEADSLRRLMAGLRPPVLEERGLMPALRETLARFGTEHGLAVEFAGTLQRDVPDDLETLAYRIVQEALANVGRHAGASRVSVYVGSDQAQLWIEIEDDGCGFDTNLARDFLHSGRVGLASMRERVELASGTFAVRSNLGRGTAVMATIPLDTALVVISD